MTGKKFFGQNPLLKRAFSVIFALFLVVGALAFMGCPMEDDSTDGGVGLDSRLEGTWEFDDAGYGGERYIIDGTSLTHGSLRGTGADAVFTEIYVGTIVHAESFSNSVGIIIIKFTDGHEYVWVDSSNWHEDPPDSGNWVADPLDPQPIGKYFGIYYTHLKKNDDGKLEVKFVNTTDQANNYGPTVTETLEAAIERFTIENMNQLMDIDAGEPTHKVD
jgi:hypothetical protein